MSDMRMFFEQYLDYPMEIYIETTGRCNARCIFCPHHTLERRNKDMPDELFSHIVDQLAEIPADHAFYVSPYKVNEPLMDRGIFDKIAMINERVPNARIRFVSNFNAAREEDMERLLRTRNLLEINISINSLDAEEYHALMGLKFEKTLGNVLRFLQMIREQGIQMDQPRITLSRVSQTPATDHRFMEVFPYILGEYEDLVRPQIIPREEWIDYMPSETPLLQNQPCPRWAYINICCDGTVAFCSMDGRAAYPLGNVREYGILEMYNQPMFRRLRTEIPNKADVFPCNRCSL